MSNPFVSDIRVARSSARDRPPHPTHLPPLALLLITVAGIVGALT